MFDNRNDINTNTFSPSIYLHNSVNVRVEIFQSTIDSTGREGYLVSVAESEKGALRKDGLILTITGSITY